MEVLILLIVLYVFLLLLCCILVEKLLHNRELNLLSSILAAVLVGAIVAIFIILIFPTNKDNVLDLLASPLEWFKVLVPLISAILTEIALFLAANTNLQTAKNNQKQSEIIKTDSESKMILEMIKFNNQILRDIKIADKNIFKDSLLDIFNKLSSTVFLIDRGAVYVKSYLEDETNKNNLLNILNKLSYAEGTMYDRQKLNLLEIIKHPDIENCRTFWATVNSLSGPIAVKFGVLNSENYYEFNESWDRYLLKGNFITSSLMKRHFFDDIIQKNAAEEIMNQPVSFAEMTEVCSAIFDKNYEKLGHFFRTTHRIIKLINNSFDGNMDLKKEYFGILRAQLPDEVLQTIFYNSVYYKKGYGMGLQLVNSNFFGDKDDFEIETTNDKIKLYKDSQHIYIKNIILCSSDCQIIFDFFTSSIDRVKINNSEVFKEKLEKSFESNQVDSYSKSLNSSYKGKKKYNKNS